jgi:hypothetical protein
LPKQDYILDNLLMVYGEIGTIGSA